MGCNLVGTKPLSKTVFLLIGPLGTIFKEILIETQDVFIEEDLFQYVADFFIEKNTFGNAVCKMAAILSQPLCIRGKLWEQGRWTVSDMKILWGLHGFTPLW